VLDSVGMLRRGLLDPGNKGRSRHQCRQLLYCDRGLVLSKQRAHCLAFDRDFDFSQDDMPYFRRRIALDCVAMAVSM
jgi:hypothetical protein